MSTHDARTRWGRTKNGRTPAMGIAVPVGLVISALAATAATWAGIAGPRPLLGALAFILCLAPTCVMAIWVIVVDRKTLAGAADRPEESVESRWYDRAAAGAQTDVVLIAGVAAVILALVPDDGGIAPELVLVGVIAVSFLCFGVRYQLLRRRG